MHHSVNNLVGRTFASLTIEAFSHTENGATFWKARCRCGGEIVCMGKELTRKRKGIPKPSPLSCGCETRKRQSEQMKKHGMSGHPVFFVWRSMRDRCNLETHQAWHNYGGRGIKVCDEWNESFEVFWEDMKDGYAPGLQLDRENNDEGYFPGNCRWVTRRVNCRNTRSNRRIETPWGRITTTEAAERAGLNLTTLLYRISSGWGRDRLFAPTATPIQGVS